MWRGAEGLREVSKAGEISAATEDKLQQARF